MEDYCPIKLEDGSCKAGGECNHEHCWEKMHYSFQPKELENKLAYWRNTRRGDASRWEKKEAKKYQR